MITRALLVAFAALALLDFRGSRQTLDPLAARSKGRRDAPVTLYEMSDFQCPYCRDFALGTMPLLEHEYIATGKVRLVYINLPLTNLHANARAAAQVALCAGRQDRFWVMHDLLFRHQNAWAKLPKPEPFLLALGDSARLDRAALARCSAAKSTAAEVDADAARARRAGAASTPTFYIEGGLLEGAAPVTVFRAVLDSIYRTKTGR
jgi:protein-disulfide isomerase